MSELAAINRKLDRIIALLEESARQRDVGVEYSTVHLPQDFSIPSFPITTCRQND